MGHGSGEGEDTKISIPGPKELLAGDLQAFGNNLAFKAVASDEWVALSTNAISFLVSEGGTGVTALKGGHLEERRGRRA